jgi:hypothetical protein
MKQRAGNHSPLPSTVLRVAYIGVIYFSFNLIELQSGSGLAWTYKRIASVICRDRQGLPNKGLCAFVRNLPYTIVCQAYRGLLTRD